MFVTKSSMLAEKVEKYFLEHVQALNLASMRPEDLKLYARKRVQFRDSTEGLLLREDTSAWRDKFPGRFSELGDRDFPLFITYDRVCDVST